MLHTDITSTLSLIGQVITLNLSLLSLRAQNFTRKALTQDFYKYNYISFIDIRNIYRF